MSLASRTRLKLRKTPADVGIEAASSRHGRGAVLLENKARRTYNETAAKTACNAINPC
jgi:hypothetical protein